MIKENIILHRINIVLFIFSSLIFLSCKGVVNKSNLQNTISLKKINSQSIILQDNPLNKQISQVVRTIFQDSKGDIWFGTQNGAFRLRNKKLIHFDGIKSETGKGVTIKDITEDKNGKIWLGHTNGVSCVDEEKYTNYYQSDGLISNDVWSIASDSVGKIWIGTVEGVSVFDGQEFANFELPEGFIDPTRGVSSTKMVHCIMEDYKGTMWFCSNAGLFSYSDNTLINISEKVGMQTNFVNKIIEVNKGEFWVSTKEALFKLKNNELTNITKEKLEVGKGIGSLAEDNKGNVWFVSNQHFLYTFDRKEIKKIKKTENNKGPVVFQIYKDQDNRLWFVGYGGAYRLENGKFINITQNGPW